MMSERTAMAVAAAAASPHRTGRVRSNDVELFYRLFGAPGSTPVLIAHGMSYFSYDWIGVAAALAGDREVVAPDQRGFGESDWSPTGDYAVGAFAGDIVTLLDHLGWRRAVLMGHSMGGRNVTWCAAEHPDRVAGVILVDWSPQTAKAGSARVRAQNSGLPDAFATVEEAMAYFGKGGRADDPEVRARFEAFLRPVAGGYAIRRDTFFRDRSRAAVAAGQAPGLVSDRRSVDMWEVLSRLACPVMVIRGTKSDMFEAGTAARLGAAHPSFGLVEIDSGHDVAGDNPAGLIGAVRPFIERVTTEETS